MVTDLRCFEKLGPVICSTFWVDVLWVDFSVTLKDTARISRNHGDFHNFYLHIF